MYHVRSPGRVNLIGEHTDYSGGYAMPIATDLATTLDAEPAEDVTVISEAMDETRSFSIDSPEPADDWGDYVRGCYAVLDDAGYEPGGFEGTIGGDLPLGSGLSSSASLELAVLAFLGAAYDLDLSREEIARLGQRVENEFVGVDCGLMDQLAVALSKARGALFVDIGAESYTRISLPNDLQFVVVHTGVERSLVDSPYNERRETVQSALDELGVAASPAVDLAMLDRLDDEQARRLGYVVRENARVRQAATALDDGDAEWFGQILLDAHEDIAESFEASTPELDAIVESAVENGAYGARLTGAGWGGAAVVAVDADRASSVAEAIERDYRESFPEREPRTYLVEPSDGVTVTDR
ncbi:MAG: galactokinase [Halapricum sp.]